MKKKEEPSERRQYIRIKKNFIIAYRDPDEPKVRHRVTQLKNISKGGMCFITNKEFAPSHRLVIELRTPYLVDIENLEGIVQQSHQKLPDIIYETRLKFENLTPQAELLLEKLEEYFRKGAQNNHE